MTTTATATHKTILVVIIGILLYGLTSGIRATFSVFTTEISDATGLSYGTVSTIFAICNLVFAFSGPAFGLLTQKIPIKYILASGAALTTIGLVGAAFSSQYVPLLIFIGVFFGLGAGALCYAIVYAAITPFLGQKHAAVCAGILSASQGAFNIMIAPFVQSLGSSASGLIICFVVLGAIAACLVPVCLIIFRKKNYRNLESTVNETKPSKSILAPLKYMFKRPYFYILILGFLTYGLCDGMMANHLYENATAVFSVSAEYASVLVMIYGAALIIGPLIGGVVAARTKNLRLFVMGIYCVWVALYILNEIIPTSTLSVSFIVFGLGIFASMLVPTLSILVMEKSPALLFASILPVIQTFLYFGYSINGYLGGFCYDLYGNFLIPAIVTCIMCGVVIVLFLISGLRYRKEKTENHNQP